MMQARASEERTGRTGRAEHTQRRSGNNKPDPGTDRRKHGEHMDGSIRPDHRPWLLEHLDDIKEASTKKYSEDEWRAMILDLRGASLDLSDPGKEAG